MSHDPWPAISGECDYQLQKWSVDGILPSRSLFEYILFMEEYCDRARVKAAWDEDEAALHELRKVAALAFSMYRDLLGQSLLDTYRITDNDPRSEEILPTLHGSICRLESILRTARRESMKSSAAYEALDEFTAVAVGTMKRFGAPPRKPTHVDAPASGDPV